jgi:hypothetical protein
MGNHADVWKSKNPSVVASRGKKYRDVVGSAELSTTPVGNRGKLI